MKKEHFEITAKDGTVTLAETITINESLGFSKTYNKDENGYDIKNLMLHIVENDKSISLNEKQMEALWKFIKGY